MSITYKHWVSDEVGPEAVDRTEEHVRAHISSLADPDDDAERYAADVKVVRRRSKGGTNVVGHLDREPDAPYLWASFDVDSDAGRYVVEDYPRNGDER